MVERFGRSDESTHEIMLRTWSEYIGYLQEFEVNNNIIKLKFENGDVLKLPRSSELGKRLRNLLKKKISVLRTDIPGKEFILHDFEAHENIYCMGGDSDE